MDTTQLILTGILSGGVAVALITAVKELFLWVLNRKAKKQDKKSDAEKNISDMQDHMKKSDAAYEIDMKRLTKILEKLEETLDISIDSNRLLLQDRIYFIATSYLKDKSISFENRKRVHAMWEIYHYRMKCNGDLDPIMKQIDAMPLDVQDHEE